MQLAYRTGWLAWLVWGLGFLFVCSPHPHLSTVWHFRWEIREDSTPKRPLEFFMEIKCFQSLNHTQKKNHLGREVGQILSIHTISNFWHVQPQCCAATASYCWKQSLSPLNGLQSLLLFFHQVLILFQIQHSSHNRPQEYPPKIEQLHFEEKYSRSELIF